MASRAGKNPDGVGASPDLAVEALLWVVGPDLGPHGLGERGEGEDVLNAGLNFGGAGSGAMRSAQWVRLPPMTSWLIYRSGRSVANRVADPAAMAAQGVADVNGAGATLMGVPSAS